MPFVRVASAFPARCAMLDVSTQSIACRGQNIEIASLSLLAWASYSGQNRELTSWALLAWRSVSLLWRRWIWLASALLGHSMGHSWQLWFVQALASKDQNRSLAIWVCLVRRLLKWRPPTRRAMKGNRVKSVVDVPPWRRWFLLVAALVGYESALYRFTRSECLLLNGSRCK